MNSWLLKNIAQLAALCTALLGARSCFAIMITYSPCANLFYALDQTTEALPEFFRHGNRSDWQACIALNGDIPSELLARYASNRGIPRYRTPLNTAEPGNNNGYFNPHPTDVDDPVAEAFYSSTTAAEALLRLQNHLEAEKLAFLEGVYKTHQIPFNALLNSPTMAETNILLSALNQGLEKRETQQTLAAFRAFFEGDDIALASLCLLWLPSAGSDTYRSTVYKNHLLFMLSPASHAQMASSPETCLAKILHEIAHYYSGCMSAEKKQALSEAFTDKRPDLKSMSWGDGLAIVEEPIIQALELYYLRRVNTGYEVTEVESYPGLINLVASYLDESRPLDTELIEKLADLSS